MELQPSAAAATHHWIRERERERKRVENETRSGEKVARKENTERRVITNN